MALDSKTQGEHTAMQNLGYKLVMTSTQSDEQAQHFYRKIGYIDSGCLLLFKEPAEIFLVKYFNNKTF